MSISTDCPALERLFLVVADICDGVPYKELKGELNSAYEAVLETPVGQEWYNRAVIERNREL